MNAQHTPGPWYADDDADEVDIVATGLSGCSRFGAAGEWEVASIRDDEFISQPQRIANARLIAAAPELLEALKALHERYVMAIGNEGPEALTARAAIAKAAGAA